MKKQGKLKLPPLHQVPSWWLLSKYRRRSICWLMVKDPVDHIILLWAREGKKIIRTNKGDFPLHPDYYYRLSGEWSSWQDILGQRENEIDLRNDLDETMFSCIDATEDECYRRITKL